MNRKLEYFFKNKKRVHITCSSRFYNGIILDIDLKKDLLILIDDKIGEVPILFEEIENVETFKEGKNG